MTTEEIRLRSEMRIFASVIEGYAQDSPKTNPWLFTVAREMRAAADKNAPEWCRSQPPQMRLPGAGSVAA
jgi:hypothetical protein